ncbi:hypothetical protein L1O03_00325 [Corynebacterium uropygiale]|uniref:Uncharacterized protein n=1 Tax=Corynebacterium uropygiale TaxID=1775911 RepID=A0A9X1QPV4_9CORY|nr:hypothetical protein [Corynebacterium uropygiale]MCF4005633.1 hypothetical protein [Corynebacterium uropygiale]
MFGFLKKKAPEAAEHVAAQHTDLPLNDFMTRLMAQELPMLDSTSRGEVYAILREYKGETICSQEQLPERIRELMDL